jgi:8-oxo-dGTP pyrophosphatase MutT (NUDIX family)
MSDGAEHDNRLVAGSEFFSRAQERLTFDVPAALTNPDAIAGTHAYNADPAALAAIAAVRPIRSAAVLVPVVQRNEPSVLLTERTARLGDHGGEISFPGGKIDAGDASPLAAALREANEEIGLAREFVEPIGYLDLHITPFGHRILPVLARVLPGFALRPNCDEVEDAFEVPLADLMVSQIYKRETLDWNGFSLDAYAIQFGRRKIWGATAIILWNLMSRCAADDSLPPSSLNAAKRRHL